MLAEDREEAALSLLESKQSLKWVKEEATKAFPLHIASSRVSRSRVGSVIGRSYRAMFHSNTVKFRQEDFCMAVSILFIWGKFPRCHSAYAL